MKSTADLVVHPPLSHLAQRVECHIEILLTPTRFVLAQKKSKHHRIGKFRCTAESAMRMIDVLSKTRRSFFQGLYLKRTRGLFAMSDLFEVLQNLGRGIGNILRSFVVRLCDPSQDTREGRQI